jgi:hypothetical protein
MRSELNDVQFTAVAVRHPSAMLSNQAGQQDTDAIAAAANATDKDEQTVEIGRTQPWPRTVPRDDPASGIR